MPIYPEDDERARIKNANGVLAYEKQHQEAIEKQLQNAADTIVYLKDKYDEQSQELAHGRMKLSSANQYADAMSTRMLALEDKLSKLLDTIEGEGTVTAQTIKECRYILSVSVK